MPVVMKRPGAPDSIPIEAQLFQNSDADEVSALLFSGAHFQLRPEASGQEPGRDFWLLHNPFAKRPFPFDQMKSGRELFVRLDERDHRAAPR